MYNGNGFLYVVTTVLHPLPIYVIFRPIIRGFGSITTIVFFSFLSIGSFDLSYWVEPIEANRVVCELQLSRVRAENKVRDELELSFEPV